MTSSMEERREEVGTGGEGREEERGGKERERKGGEKRGKEEKRRGKALGLFHLSLFQNQELPNRSMWRCGGCSK